MKLKTSAILLVITAFGFTAHGSDTSQRGAYTMPYVRYDSQQARSGGGAVQIASPDFDITSPASEAIHQEYMKLPEKGAWMAWTIDKAANGLTVRFTMPDSETGDGTTGSLDVVVNGRKAVTVELTSYWAYQYIIKGVPWRQPAPDRYPVMRFDEQHFTLPVTLKKGDELRLVKADGEEIGVDFVELEVVPAPLPKPEGWLSIVEFGAIPDDEKDDLPALMECIKAAQAQGTGVYIPSGAFTLHDRLALLLPGTKIQGAGIWHTELFFSNPLQGKGGVWGNSEDLHLSDLYMNTICAERMVDRQSVSYNGIAGTWRGKSTIRNIWLEHFRAGVWIAGYNNEPISEGLLVSNLRVRNHYADGIHFANGTSNCIAEYCDVRNCGDDGLASWSSTNKRMAICNQGNTFRWCTVELGWRASAIGLFGGGGHRVHHCYVGEMSGSSALRFTSDFPGCPYDPTDPMKVWECTFYKSGSRSTFYNQIYGAIELHGKLFDILNMEMEKIDIIDAQVDAIRMTGRRVRGIVLRHVNIRGAGSDGKSHEEPGVPPHRGYGLWCNTETDRQADCSATLTGVTFQDCPDGEIFNQGFKLTIEK